MMTHRVALLTLTLLVAPACQGAWQQPRHSSPPSDAPATVNSTTPRMAERLHEAGQPGPSLAADAPSPNGARDPNLLPGPARTEGTSEQNAIARCGAADSYAFIANEFRCADGSQPFAGDLHAAARARVGNVGANAAGHIIDLYRVPCPEGPQDVYVDMYAGCGPGQSPY